MKYLCVLLVSLLINTACNSMAFAIQEVESGATDNDSKDEKEKDKKELPTIESKVEGLTKSEGFVTFYWDEAEGKIWLEFDNIGEPFIYVTGLSSGLGSNPVGLDRGQLGGTRLVSWRRVGKRVYLEQPNLDYRSSSSNPAERQAIADSFAQSIIFSADIAAESEGRVLIDGTSLLVRDVHDVAQTLRRSSQGSFSLDGKRSFVVAERTKAFPNNSEFEIALTFSASDPGPRIRETTPSPNDVTLRQHHSMVALPEDGYEPRKFHPRIGGLKISFADYSVPLTQSLDQHWIARHRLQKADPNADRSKPVEPIIYYLDPGVPQPVRDALLEGARWWNAAFESAGFIDGFQVQMLPEDADPLDVRYNVIQWVHRSTRGWSYGQSVVDPRTGEIIKGHVLLGSLRVRQDRLINEGLIAQATSDSKAPAFASMSLDHAVQICSGDQATAWELNLDPTQAVDVALARIRQLSAHEVGHTIGFSHNFAASTYDDRASVMDYPAPRILIDDDGNLDLSDAYGVGVGSWDHISVRYAYTEFGKDANEAEELKAIVEEVESKGMLYLSDADARPSSAAHPSANLWDNGSDPIEELKHLLKVRSIAIDQFSDRSLNEGQPLSELEMAFVPIYLLHRYQVDAVSKMIGGVEYNYAVQGGSGTAVKTIPLEQQKEALELLLTTLEPESLAIPKEVYSRFHPKPYSLVNDIERFDGKTGLIFDPVSAALTSADMTLQSITNVERLNRLATHGNGLTEAKVLNAIVASTFESETSTDPELRQIQFAVQLKVLERLMDLAENSRANTSLQSASYWEISGLPTKFLKNEGESEAIQAANRQRAILGVRIEQFLEGADKDHPFPNRDPLPPGSPIGSR